MEEVLCLKSKCLSQKSDLDKQAKKLEENQILMQKKDWKIHAKEKELASMKGKLRKSERELNGIKCELTALVENNELYHNSKGLEEAVRRIYHQYVKNQHITS